MAFAAAALVGSERSLTTRAWLTLAGSLLLSACHSGAKTLGWELSGPAEIQPGEPHPWFGGPAYYERWQHGISSDPGFFPLGVWMQSPDNAQRFQAVGLNLYVGLWQGPTTEQLVSAAAVGMPAVCSQAGVWKENLTSSTIQGWLHSDSPDNAQMNADGSYGDCIDPTETQAQYRQMTEADATRPVVLLLGVGAAETDWIGRGSCTGRTDMYPGYVAGADIVVHYSYPINKGLPLELVGRGLDNLNGWAGFEKPVLAGIEASSIYADARPTPTQIRAEVWISLIHGAAGIEYFCHRFSPDFSETDCLEDPETAAALTRINAEVTELVPALNSQSYAMKPESSNPLVPVDAVLKKPGAELYVFAAGMADGRTTARFSLSGLGSPTRPGGPDRPTRIEVIGEARSLVPQGESFEDDFEPYAVHLYRLH